MNQDDLQTKDRILQTAFGLFLDRGYENTPVQAIIDAVGIAKGTFYHHFQSKEEMLVELVEQMSRRVVEAVAPVVRNPALNATEKMLAVSRAAVSQKTEDFGPEVLVLVRQMRQKANRQLADAIARISAEWIRPLYAAVIVQGVGEGRFRVTDAALAADLVVGMILSTQDRITGLFLEATGGDASAVDRLVALYQSLEEAVERILGAAAGTLPIYTVVNVRDLLARILPGGSR